MSLCDYGCGREGLYQFKNGKNCCSKHQIDCLEIKRKTVEGFKKRYHLQKEVDPLIRIPCNYCGKQFSLLGMPAHQNFCYLNPKNIKLCPVCQKPIKNFRSNTTCSYYCANAYFKEKYINSHAAQRNPDNYASVCFRYHKRECIICGEYNAIAVHHYDNNKKNNDPRNLVPFCMNHHFYIHTLYLKESISEKMNQYVDEFSKSYTGKIRSFALNEFVSKPWQRTEK